MKTRTSFVSNSSSSSFLVRGWSSLPQDTKTRIREYCRYALEVWQSLGLPISNEHGCPHVDEGALRRMASGGTAAGITLEEFRSKYDFGWLEKGGWEMEELDDGGLEMTTVVDNFDMDKWLGYLGVEHEYLGENLGFFRSDFADPGSELFRPVDLPGKNDEDGGEG